MMSTNGELTALAILEEMKNGTEFGQNFSKSVEKIVFDRLTPAPTSDDNFHLFCGNKVLTPSEILKEMREGTTEFGKEFLNNALKYAFEIIKLSLNKT